MGNTQGSSAQNAKAFHFTPTSNHHTARERKHQISKLVKVNMSIKSNRQRESTDVLAKITPGMSKLNAHSPAPNPFKLIQDQKNAMNLPTLNFDNGAANKWLDGVITKITEENKDVDFFSKQIKIVKSDGSKVDINEALI